MPGMGLEPIRPFGQPVLSRPRLPITPPGLVLRLADCEVEHKAARSV